MIFSRAGGDVKVGCQGVEMEMHVEKTRDKGVKISSPRMTGGHESVQLARVNDHGRKQRVAPLQNKKKA